MLWWRSVASLFSDALLSGADVGSEGVTIVAAENCLWAGTTTPSNKELKLTKPAFGASQLNSVFCGPGVTSLRNQ